VTSPHPSPLPLAAPSSVGVDAAGILRFVDALESSPGQEPHGLVVLRHGAVIARGWWSPYSPERPQLVYSLSKSFTAAAAGLLFDEGRLGLDEPVVSFFPEFADEITDPRTRRMLVRHVASMSSGHLGEMLETAVATDGAEPVRGFLLHPPEREPGSVFAYNQPAAYTLAAIVQRLAGRTLVELLRERVLDPIGAGPVSWQEHPAGRDLGFTGSFMTTDTIARLGQLLLRRGVWGDRRILSDEWVGLATGRQVETVPDRAAAADSDWAQGYGFQHWQARHGFRGDGAIGQFCLVLPEQDAVVAIQAQSPDMQQTLDAAWRHLLPAFGGPGTPDADAELARRLAAATLPPLRVDGAEPAAEWDGARLVAGWLTVAVRRTAEGWRAVLTGATGDVEAAFVPGATGMTDAARWRVTDEGGPVVAVSGGFATPDRLALDVAFLETPHRLHVVLDLPGRTGTAAWEAAPLREPHDLRVLAAPRPFG